jgi:hypothetical protein
MICCSRRPTRLFCCSMDCTSRVAQGMLPVRWQHSGSFAHLDFKSCLCLSILAAKSTEIR